MLFKYGLRQSMYYIPTVVVLLCQKWLRNQEVFGTVLSMKDFPQNTEPAL